MFKAKVSLFSALLFVNVQAADAQSFEACREGTRSGQYEALVWCLDQLSKFAENSAREIQRLREQNEEFSFLLQETRENRLPVGAVMPFDLPDGCPRGWVHYASSAGRVIVGEGVGSGNTRSDESLTERRYREMGGAEYHSLSERELPQHSHNFTLNQRKGSGNGTVTFGRVPGDSGSVNARHRTEVAGSGVPHNNMQPYVVLYYCIKQ